MKTLLITCLLVLNFSEAVYADIVLNKSNILAYYDLDTTKNIKLLFNAAKTGDLPSLEKALKTDLKVNDSNHTGTTALMIAAKYGNIHIVKALLNRGAKIDLRNNSGLTALDFARMYQKEEVLTYLQTKTQ